MAFFKGKKGQSQARTSASRGIVHECDTEVQTTCFGLRRRKPVKKPRIPSIGALQNSGQDSPVKEVDADRESTLAGRDESSMTGSTKAKRIARMCGASAILTSFSNIGPEIMATDPPSLFRSPTKPPRSNMKPLALAEDDAQADSGKILASYDNIRDAKPESSKKSGNELEEDGADSLEEEDTFSTPTWIIDPHDIYFIPKADNTGKVCRLGKGDYGPVYLGVWKDQEVSVKLAKQKPISLKQERIFQEHVSNMYQLDHPNVVPFLGACCWKGGKRTVLVTEYMDKGDLRKLLSREDLIAKFAWVQHGKAVAMDLAKGLAYLHSKGVVHGRLKSTNVLMNKAGVAKIADPSLWKLLGHCKDPERAGPPSSRNADASALVAPEIILGGEPSFAADVYGLGVILWELLSMETPGRKLRSIRTPEEAPARIAYLVECCLSKDPEARPTAEKIISMISSKR